MLKVAVVGIGSISNHHIKALLKFPERCKIVAFCDIYPEKAEKSKELYNLDCKIYDNHETMLKEMDIDVVHISTPPYTHAEIAINSMNSGKNVIVEKPMATCLKECDEMLAAAKANNVLLSAIAQNRFTDGVYKLKAMADSKLAGEIRVAHINSFWNRGHCYYDLWWRGTWEKEGGGCTLNHAVHHIDMLNWLKGELPCEISAVLSNVMHDNAEVEDISSSTAKYSDNSLAQITASVVHHQEEQGIVLQCEHGKISNPWTSYASNYKENGFPEPNDELKNKLDEAYKALPDLVHTGHSGQIDDVMSCLENGGIPKITGEDGRRTIELITGIYKAGIEKRTISFPITADDKYYTFQGLLDNAPHFYEKSVSIENFGDTTIKV